MKFQLRSGLAAMSLAALSACGGGSTQIEPFKPTRLLAFGDEQAFLAEGGKRYGVNALKTGTTTGEVDCAGNPILAQAMATQFSLVLARCNPDNKPVTGYLLGAVGAKVADVKAQIDQHFAASGTVGPKDLITLQVGTHDLVEIYQQFPLKAEAELIELAKTRGKALADQVNRLANANGRIIILTTVDIGLTPYGQAQKAAHTDTDRAALMGRLTAAFNSAMRLGLIEDGRLIGLALADESIATIAKFPSGFGFTDVVKAACTTALPNCTTATLDAAVGTNTWLWADSLRLGPAGATSVNNLAVGRAVNNPF
ncbi:phospholipase/lecithinase/hemolysin [Inhella inkyongensis]|uniref:Phospholipase/lecithinase/hemolysin n=1 Tax=Inhella inkyongensis TaxID=392593 RepID=A0A840S0Q4_9BURK|nr:esterase [Inhella inkyongensis]MBB5203092.1 phospholipase/lecithinase/hemolysin [Inhella inkyongensis]